MRLTTVALAALVLASTHCRNVSRFSTGSGHYEGTVVAGSFVRDNVPDNTRICVTIDTERLQDGPGTLSTSDGRFSLTPMRQIPQLLHDPLSTLSFGEGRERNLIYMAAPNASEPRERMDVTVVISLMDSGDIEVRLLRGAPAAPSPDAPAPIFGVFVLNKAEGACPF